MRPIKIIMPSSDRLIIEVPTKTLLKKFLKAGKASYTFFFPLQKNHGPSRKKLSKYYRDKFRTKQKYKG